MWHSFDSLKSVLQRNIKQKGLAGKVENTLILEEFEKIAREIWGEVIARDMKPIYVKQNILYIAVLNSTVGQEIMLRKKLIISELTRKFGTDKVTDLRIDY